MGKRGHISPSCMKHSLSNGKFPIKGRLREWSNYYKEMQHININSNADEALPAENNEASILLISVLSGSSEYCKAQG